MNGTLEDVDVYIDCQKGVRIYYFGHSTLEAYIPSLQQGRNILRFIYRDYLNKSNTETTFKEYDVEKDGKQVHVVKENINILNKELYDKEIADNSIVFHIEESDSEVLFRFNVKHMENFEKYFKPKTSGANISPFSSKNLPKNKAYKIPDETLIAYKEILAKIPPEHILALTHSTNNYLKSLATKKNTWEDIKADMKLKGLKAKEYIHSIGEWDNYINYLKEELSKGEL